MSESNTDNKIRIDEYIASNDCEEKDSIPVILKGEKKRLSVYKLPIKLLYYNIRNGRFAAEYRNEVKKQGGDLVPEKKEDSNKIRNLLWNLDINESKRTYDDIKQRGQWQPGIITEDGYVIDGNRRMTVLSKLFLDTSNDDFKFIKVGRLPSDIERNDLWKLEAGIQLGKDEILRYGPMNELLKLEEGVEAGISIAEIAKTLYGFDDPKEIEEKLDRLELIKKYLDYIGQTENFKQVDGKVEHFAELQKIISTEKKMNVDPTTKISIRNAVFCLIKQGMGHRELRKIEKMIRIQLTTAIEKVISLAEGCKDMISLEPTMDDQVVDTIDTDPLEENDPITTLYTSATDILDAELNKDHIAELLRRAAVNLEAVDFQNPDLKKPQVKELIERILVKTKRLEEIGE